MNIDIRKVPDKTLIYEIKMPDRTMPGDQTTSFTQDTFAGFN